jgi:hypothetical protein
MSSRLFVRDLAKKVVGHTSANSYHKMSIETISNPDFPSSPLDAKRPGPPVTDAFRYNGYDIILRQYPKTFGIGSEQGYSFSLFVQRSDGKENGLKDLIVKLREALSTKEFMHKQEKRVMDGTPNVNFSPGSPSDTYYPHTWAIDKSKTRKPNIKIDLSFAQIPNEETLFWTIYRGAISPLMKVFRSSEI